MKFFIHLLLISSLFSSAGQACIVDEFGNGHGLLPDNDMNIPVGMKSGPGKGSLSEEQFNEVITKLETIYKPIFAEKGFTKFEVFRKWDNGTVNASAMQGTFFKKNRYVNMYGGLARHSTVTVDGFALVLCHEIGHHLGGFPKVSGFGSAWASNEGQSDYYGATKCMQKFIEVTPTIQNLTIDPVAKAKCEQTNRNAAEVEVCGRIAMAGKSLGDLFAALGNTTAPRFDTPTSEVASSTNDSHPKAQCRLDTYLSGALCDKSFEDEMPNDNEFTGACTTKDGSTVGTRPLCWFKPSASL